MRARRMPGRRLVVLVTSAAATVALLGGVSPSGSVAVAAPDGQIQHVIVIYQENHSFDEVLGALCVQDSRCDGSLTATLLNGSTRALTKSADVVPTVNHDTKSMNLAINGGLMNGWERISGCQASGGYKCLTYYAPDQIPNLAALARTYAISDRSFEMDKVASFGAHIELVAGTLDGFTGVAPKPQSGYTALAGWGCDSNKFAQWKDPAIPTAKATMVPACIPDYTDPLTLLTGDRSPADGGAITSTPVRQVDTLMDELDAAGLTWKIYASSKTSSPSAYNWAICPVFAGCLYTSQSTNMVAPSQVVTDATAGALPSFSIVLPQGPTGSTSQHNGASMLKGDNWIGQVMNAVMQGPEWSSTAVFITYDDCGCFYDHVVPPTGLGIREPMVIVSPLAKPGFTDSTVASTASMLAFTEHTFGLAPLTSIDAAAYDYSNALDLSQPLAGPTPMRTSPISAKTRHYLRTHPADLDDPT